MIDKETYKRELIRMFDSLRVSEIGEKDCNGVICEECPLYYVSVCHSYSSVNAYEVYEKAIKCIDYVEKWAREHPPKKYKVSKLEYSILEAYIDLFDCGGVKMLDFPVFDRLHEIGYFKGATNDMCIKDYFNNCEVKEDV